jgi:hypothetical protein
MCAVVCASLVPFAGVEFSNSGDQTAGPEHVFVEIQRFIPSKEKPWAGSHKTNSNILKLITELNFEFMSTWRNGQM